MFSIRLIRKLAACIAILGMLFTQFAVSAFACPAIAQALEATVMMDSGDLQPCYQTADVAGGLCQAHCEDGQKNVGTSHVPPADFVPAFSVTLPILDASQQAQLAFAAANTAPPPSPPVHLRNCVFRI